MSLKDKINLQKLPKHIAIIMDGNGRWAKGKGKFRIFGHQNGVKAVKESAEACAELGVSYLTLYAFSTENWSRPKDEINALMELLVSTIRKETSTLQKNNIRLKAIGDLMDLPPKCQRELQEAIEETKNNTRLTLILALSYSAKWDMVNAIKQIAEKAANHQLHPQEINDMLIDQHLSTKDYPHPELMIRTSGEQRISNFLLWELAYSELYFTPVLWPDFTREHLYEAIFDYQQRERRFGKTSEQVLKP
ncbi:MAG: isoprenyl transferase [Bacteroidia bacterium]|jgi:undecaprenyl diphosphate synthase|nr:isoprenyl transferase [Bacteroidia bacterium]